MGRLDALATAAELEDPRNQQSEEHDTSTQARDAMPQYPRPSVDATALTTEPLIKISSASILAHLSSPTVPPSSTYFAEGSLDSTVCGQQSGSQRGISNESQHPHFPVHQPSHTPAPQRQSTLNDLAELAVTAPRAGESFPASPRIQPSATWAPTGNTIQGHGVRFHPPGVAQIRQTGRTEAETLCDGRMQLHQLQHGGYTFCQERGCERDRGEGDWVARCNKSNCDTKICGLCAVIKDRFTEAETVEEAEAVLQNEDGRTKFNEDNQLAHYPTTLRSSTW
ncbi:hypothetical protein BJ508DRAFT_339819 [Ascobolus immersus RN42]|uniref:Uncharacterized protein n=1 Tax=Ascobolus immersus RN42 TaxID=1160509 RepID=A0A3N4HLI2_ASCIM|nr:hypothetical protein BJ508DRAFT_339819 [Ascobolus immersus RN42]